MKNECLRLIGTKPLVGNNESRKCANCKHCDEVKKGLDLIHCSHFEQYMPIEIGKCDMWERRDLD